MSTLIVKSLTGSALPLENLSAPNGVIPASGSSVTLTDFNTIDEIQNDEQLYGYVTASLVVLDDGTRELNADESENALVSLYAGFGTSLDGTIFKFDQTTGNIVGTDIVVDGNGDFVVNSGSVIIGPGGSLQVSGTTDIALDDLSDVSSSLASPGQLLAWNGSQWIPSGSATGGEVNDGENLGSGQGVFAQKSGLNLQFKSLNTGSSPNLEIASTATEISYDLADNITLTSVTASILGDVTGDLTGDVTGNVLGNVTGDVTGNVLGNVTGQVSDISNHNLSGLGDVSSSVDSAALGDVLYYDGSNWVTTPSGNVGEINTAANVGAGEGVFAQKNGAEFEFKSLTNDDSNLVISGSSTEIDISLANDVIISNNLTVTGDFTVNGTASTINTENLFVEDPLITLASGNTAQTLDQGFIVTRSGSNQGVLWDESADEFALISTTEDGTTAGNVTIDGYAPLHIGNLTAANINAVEVTASFLGDLVGNVTGQVSDISNHSIGEISNVSSSADSAVSGTFLSYNGSTWIPANVPPSGETNTASNLGGGEGVYAQKVGSDLQLKSLTEGLGIVLSSSATEISFALSSSINDYGVRTSDPVAGSDGDKYYNSTLGMQMYYDGTRSKWLSVESFEIVFGRDGNMPAGSYYKGIDGKTMSEASGKPAFFDGTIVSMGYTRGDSDAAIFEVTSDGNQIAFLSSSATLGIDNTLDGDFSSSTVLAIRNQSGGNTTRDAQGWVRLKWKA